MLRVYVDHRGRARLADGDVHSVQQVAGGQFEGDLGEPVEVEGGAQSRCWLPARWEGQHPLDHVRTFMLKEIGRQWR